MPAKILTADGRIHLASCSHVYSSPAGSLTDALAEEFAKACDFITAGPKTLQGKESLMTQFTELGMYTKTNQLSDGTKPENWYSHKKGGARRQDSTWHVYPMQPDVPAWQTFHLTQLKALPTWVEDIFSDSAGEFSYTQGGRPAKPPGHTVEYTVDEWLPMIGKNIDAWMKALPDKRFLVNGLSEKTYKIYTPTVGMIENAFKSNKGVVPGQADWEKTMNLLFKAQAQGWTPWVYIKLFSQDKALWDAFRNLVVPSMFIADIGSLVFELGGKEGSPPPWVTQEYKNPLYNPDIGTSDDRNPDLAHYAISPGVYGRQFTKGAVYVNSTASAKNVTLPKTNQVVSIPAQSGRVYRLKEVVTYDWAEVS